jgi:hypothetical protein
MSYKNIIAFGDSFTRGDELTDCPDHTDDFAHSTQTWPSILSRTVGCKYHCFALGGVGNQYIGWQIANRLRPETLFIVNWTYFERFDYVDIDSDRWTTVHPRHDHKLSHYFFKHIDSEVWNTYRNLQHMHSAISLLKQNNIDFIMTCLDSKYSNSVDKMLNFTNSKWNDAIEKLHEQVSPHITTFEKLDFLSWSKHNKYEIGAQGHPLEKAHAEAAKYINMVTTEGKNYGH